MEKFTKLFQSSVFSCISENMVIFSRLKSGTAYLYRVKNVAFGFIYGEKAKAILFCKSVPADLM